MSPNDPAPPPPLNPPSPGRGGASPDGTVAYRASREPAVDPASARKHRPGEATAGIPAPPPLHPDPGQEWSRQAAPAAPAATTANAASAPPSRATQAKRLRRRRRNRSIVALVVVAGILAASWFALRDPRGIGALDTGDCFLLPDTAESVVEAQACARPHAAQVYAIVTELPGSADDSCFQEFLALDEALVDALPSDVQYSVLSRLLKHRCVVESPSGSLDGSILG